MASSFCDEGLIDLWQGALAANPGPTGTPRLANLISGIFTANPKQTYAGTVFAAGVPAVSLPSLWGFNLQPAIDTVTASAILTWTLDPTFQGSVYYGVGIYDPTVARLYYCENFPAPIIVPAGGATIPWQLFLNYGDCQSLCPQV